MDCFIPGMVLLKLIQESPEVAFSVQSISVDRMAFTAEPTFTVPASERYQCNAKKLCGFFNGEIVFEGRQAYFNINQDYTNRTADLKA